MVKVEMALVKVCNVLIDYRYNATVWNKSCKIYVKCISIASDNLLNINFILNIFLVVFGQQSWRREQNFCVTDSNSDLILFIDNAGKNIQLSIPLLYFRG